MASVVRHVVFLEKLSSYPALRVSCAFALFSFWIYRSWDFFFFPCYAFLHTLLLPLLSLKFISLNVAKNRYSIEDMPAFGQNQRSVNNEINEVACMIARLEILK